MFNRVKTAIMITFLLVIMTISVSAHTAVTPHNLHTCAISTGHGLLQDYDCDKVPNQVDNCPEHFNPEQTDSNRDGLGDVCASAYGYPIMTSKVTAQGYVAVNLGKTIPEPREKSNLNVQIKDLRDVYVGGAGAVYPIKVKNVGTSTERVSFEVVGVDFGTFRIDPNSVLVIEPEMTETAYLHVAADEGTEEGHITFDLIVSSNREQQTITMNAMLLERGTRQRTKSLPWGDVIGWILVIIVILILLAIAGREFQRRNGGKSRKLNEDIYSYY